MFHKEGDPPKSTIQFPGGTGGVNWGGMAVDPNSGYMFANVAEHLARRVGREKDPNVDYSFDARGSKQPYDRASVNGVGPFFTFSAPLNGYDTTGRPRPGPQLPCQRPPWSKLVAVNLNTGMVAWNRCSASTMLFRKVSGSSGTAAAQAPR